MQKSEKEPQIGLDRSADDDDLYCDLDPTKICDNCFRCLESDSDYASVEIDGIYMDGERII